jgi:ATP dependent DNA ligase domain
MPKKSSFPRQAAGFSETMDCLPVTRLPEGPEWTYEIKLDGYRLEAVQSAGRTTLYSRRQNVLNQSHYIATALKDLPDETVIDGELVALGPDGRPDFNLLQNFRSAESRIIYYAFETIAKLELNTTFRVGRCGTWRNEAKPRTVNSYRPCFEFRPLPLLCYPQRLPCPTTPATARLGPRQTSLY